LEDFGRHRPSSITKLKDMITTWADEEDKANDKFDAIRGKSKQNPGDSNNNIRDQGGRNNNYYSCPNGKRKPNNTVAAIQHPVKDNSKKTSGGFTPPSSATNSGEHSRILQTHGLLMTRRARKKPMRAMTISKNPTRR
jgi:hypothetical protein